MKKIFTACMLTLATLALNAQSWTSYRAAAEIKDIHQIDQNYYAATEAGVINFDANGQVLSIWDKTNSLLPSYKIEAIIHDTEKNIWIGTYDMGVARVDSNNNWSISSLDNPNPNQLLLYDLAIYNEKLYAGTNLGLYQFIGGQWVLKDFHFPIWDLVASDNGLMVASNSLHRYTEDTIVDMMPPTFAYGNSTVATRNDTIAYANDHGVVCVFDGISWTKYDFASSNIPFDNITDIKWAYDHLWISLYENGAMLLDQGIWTHITDSTSSLETNEVRSMHFDQLNNIWFGLTNGHLLKKGEQGDEIVNLNTSIQTNNVESIFEDNGNMQAANGKHLDVFDGSSWQIDDYMFLFDQYTNGWSEISQVVENPIDGSKVITTTNHGLFYHDGNSWAHYDQHNGLSQNLVLDIVTDQDGVYWIVNYEGLTRFDGTNFTNYNEQNSNLVNDDLRQIAVAADNSMYMASFDGLVHFDGNTFNLLTPANSSVANEYVSSVHMDADYNLWVGYLYGYGFSKYDGQQWEHFNNDNQAFDLDFQNHIYTIETNSSGQLAFGLEYGGVLFYDGAAWHKFKPSDSPLGSQHFHDFHFKDNNLWISGRDGGIDVYHFVPQQVNTLSANAGKDNVALYPNPSSGFIKLKMDSNNSFTKGSIFSLDGKQLQQFNIDEEMLVKASMDLANGEYMLELDDGQGNKISKTIVILR